MTATLSMVPLGKIHPSADNPRSDFDDERMVELIESVKRPGIITPCFERATEPAALKDSALPLLTEGGTQ